MATNPIQRRTRNSFILGMLVMLLIATIAIVLLYFGLFQNMIPSSSLKGNSQTKKVYRLTADVESGEQISKNKIEIVELSVDMIPRDAVNDPAIVNWKSKLDLPAGTVLGQSLIYLDTTVSKTTRLVEYNMLTLPSTIKVGDYVDVRFTMPSGQDYIVLAKKQVKGIKNTTVSFYLTEDEILMMSSAIVESYIMEASDLHIVQYVEAGTQDAPTPTYSINEEVALLIQEKGSINLENIEAMKKNYNTTLRDAISNELSQYEDNKLDNLETGMKEQKEKALSLYLSGLSEEN